MMETENNVLKLCGVIESAPVLDHEVFGEQFYRMELKVPRLSGTYDLLPVTVSERLMEGEVAPGMQIGISGQLRSYNKVIGGSGRLLLTAFAQQLGDQRRAVLHEGEHHMLLIHLLVAVFHRDLLGPLDGLDGLLGELVHIHRLSLL